MTDADLHDDGLFVLTLRLCGNGALLLISFVWLTSQFSTMVAWRNFGQHSLMVTAEHRGWIFHQLSPAVTEPYGLKFSEPNNGPARREDWVELLADSNVQAPLPGILVAQTNRFRLVAVRHWLLFILAFGVWILIQRWIARRRRHGE